MNKLPTFLYELLINQYGADITNKIIDGYNVKRLTTLRVNTLKTDCLTVMEKLDELGISYRRVDWYNDALIIEGNFDNTIRESLMYQNGEIYLQSLSSMIPALVLDPNKGESILDMAAAPGGKTCQMVALSNNEALVTACEKNKIRAERLKYNLLKQSANRVGIIVNDALKLDDFLSFDKILLDAPCSGTGTLSTEIDIEKVCSMELIERSSNIQLKLLKKAIRLLKPGHELVYSTCSILKSENEDIIKEVLKSNQVELVPIDKEKFNNIPFLPTELDFTMLVCPSELYEGFFVAKLRKK